MEPALWHGEWAERLVFVGTFNPKAQAQPPSPHPYTQYWLEGRVYGGEDSQILRIIRLTRVFRLVCPQPCSLNPKPFALNHKPFTLNPLPSTLYPKP